jgi:hypothetical protein
MERAWTVLAVAAITALTFGAILVSAGSWGAISTTTAPPPCTVGTSGCGPWPALPTHRTAISRSRTPRGALHPGPLRPGRYSHSYSGPDGFDMSFSVPAGWSWNGRALTQGNAAVYFSAGPVRIYADPCHWDSSAHPPAGIYSRGSIESMATLLAAQPMRHATGPSVVRDSLAEPSGDGHMVRDVAATEVRLTVPSNLDLSRCDHGQYRTWGAGPDTRIQQHPGQRDLISFSTVFNTPGDAELIIDAATFPDTPPGLVEQVDAILASVEAGGCSDCS